MARTAPLTAPLTGAHEVPGGSAPGAGLAPEDCLEPAECVRAPCPAPICIKEHRVLRSLEQGSARHTNACVRAPADKHNRMRGNLTTSHKHIAELQELEDTLAHKEDKMGRESREGRACVRSPLRRAQRLLLC